MAEPRSGRREDSAARRSWGSLERAEIVAAALELTRSDGLEALTVRRVASAVGAARMSMYRHIPDKAALLGLVADAIAEEDILPGRLSSGPWPQRLRQLAHRMHQEFVRYPGLAELIATHGNHGSGGLRLAEAILEILADAGLDRTTTARFYLVFLDIMVGRAQREAHGDPVSAHRNAKLTAAARSHTEFPQLQALSDHLRGVSTDEIFELELELIVSAISAAATVNRPSCSDAGQPARSDFW